MKTFLALMMVLLVGLAVWTPAQERPAAGRPGAGGGGGTGGVYTNEVLPAVIATFYTNTTAHYIEGLARLGTTTAGRIQASVTNSDNSLFFQFQEEVATAGASSNGIAFKVPPGGWWKFSGLTTTATDGSQVLTYNATNGAVSFATRAGTATLANNIAAGATLNPADGAALTGVLKDTNDVAYPASEYAPALTFDRNGFLLMMSSTNAQNGYAQTNYGTGSTQFSASEDYTNIVVGGDSLTTPGYYRGRWIQMPDLGGIQWKDGGGIWGWANHGGGGIGELQINGSPSIAIQGGSSGAVVQMGTSAETGEEWYFQYDSDTPSAGDPLVFESHSKHVSFRSRPWSGVGSVIKTPGMMGWTDGKTNTSAHGSLRFYSTTPVYDTSGSLTTTGYEVMRLSSNGVSGATSDSAAAAPLRLTHGFIEPTNTYVIGALEMRRIFAGTIDTTQPTAVTPQFTQSGNTTFVPGFLTASNASATSYLFTIGPEKTKGLTNCVVTVYWQKTNVSFFRTATRAHVGSLDDFTKVTRVGLTDASSPWNGSADAGLGFISYDTVLSVIPTYTNALWTFEIGHYGTAGVDRPTNTLWLTTVKVGFY